jgi:hypothetical protein
VLPLESLGNVDAMMKPFMDRLRFGFDAPVEV